MKILLLEDDVNLYQHIKLALENDHYIVDGCHDGESGMILILDHTHLYDIVIIDRMLPIIDGLTIVKAMRQKNIMTPVIIITALGEIENRIEGLDGGADDYLVKPFHMNELLARIRALTRRPTQLTSTHHLQYGDLSLDKENRTLSKDHRTLLLTAKEAELLSTLMNTPEKPFSREQLLIKVWGNTTEVETGNVDNYISFLRKRLKDLRSHCQITTIYGFGYKLENRHVK